MNSLKWINTIAFLAMVGVNFLANMIPIGGNTTGEVSKAYANMFTPAPITFAIWGAIYFFMLVFVVFQWGFLGPQSVATSIRNSIGFFFVASCVLNICWIFAWHLRKIEVSTILIALLLISLIFITKRITRINGSFMTYIMVNLGFDLYFGWIIAATIANVSVMLTKWNWNGWGISNVIWTIAILIVGAVIASLVVLTDNRYFSGLAVVWAYVGILIKHLSSSGYAGKYTPIIITTVVGIAVISFVVVYRLFVPNPKFRIVSSMG